MLGIERTAAARRAVFNNLEVFSRLVKVPNGMFLLDRQKRGFIEMIATHVKRGMICLIRFSEGKSFLRQGKCAEAVRCFRLSSLRSLSASAYLAYMLTNGRIGVRQDLSEAEHLIRTGAQKGNSDCCALLAVYVIQGWLTHQHGVHTLIQMSVGSVFHHWALGLENLDNLQFQKAVTNLTKAASEGIDAAYFRLAMFFYKGESGVVDYEKALHLHKVAAELGSSRSQFMIGHHYQFGKGVVVDIEEAKRWYGQAASADDPNAIAVLKRLRVRWN
jgi:TPR repeat protein